MSYNIKDIPPQPHNSPAEKQEKTGADCLQERFMDHMNKHVPYNSSHINSFSNMLSGLQQQQQQAAQTPDIIYDSTPNNQDSHDIFNSSVDDATFFSLLQQRDENLREGLSNITFICLSGVVSAGKSTAQTIIDEIFQMENMSREHDKIVVEEIHYADGLKKVIADAFGFPEEKLRNRSVQDREWMEDDSTDDSLFWTNAIIKSQYVGHHYVSKKKDTDQDTMTETENQTIDDADICNMSPSQQYIKKLKGIANEEEFPISRIPVTPRKMCEFVANNMFKKLLCDDFWIFSTIKKIVDKNCGDTKEKNRKRVYLVGDTRFLNEVMVPSLYGVNVVYIYIHREEAFKSVPLSDQIKLLIDKSMALDEQGLPTNHVMSPGVVRDYLKLYCSKHNINVKQMPTDVKWMPYWLSRRLLCDYSMNLKFEEHQRKRNTIKAMPHCFEVTNTEGDKDKMTRQLVEIIKRCNLLGEKESNA